MTTSLSDSGLSFGSNAAAYQLADISASVAANAITVTLQPCTLSFRNTTLTTGTPSTAVLASSATLTIAATDSFGLVTAAGNQRIAILAINNAGTIELAASALTGGVSLDETGVITTATAATLGTHIKSTSVRTGVAYRVIGFVDATFTTATGWGSLVLVQGGGGQALAAMSSLGYGQTWQAVTRTLGTTYYNTTGKPITVAITTALSANGALWVNGVYMIPLANSASNRGFLTAVIPAGNNYMFDAAIQSWAELR